MPTFLLLTVILMTLLTGFVIFLYLRSSFELLELVRQDEALWNRLGCPEKIHGRDFANRFATISSIGPWLSWVYSGSTAGLQPDIAARLVITRNMLLTTGVGGMFMLLGLG